MARKALSPVISSLILSAAVLTIGGSLWSYAMGASTITAEIYVNETLELANEVTERFVIEHVWYNSDNRILYITVYNYGNQKIIVDAYADITRSDDTSFMKGESGTVIQKGQSKPISIPFLAEDEPMTEGRVSIKIQSRRQNVAYKKYYIP